MLAVVALFTLLGTTVQPSLARADELDAGAMDNELAKLHYRVGTQHYAREEFRAALLEFAAAFAVVPLPALRYDMARCQEHLGRLGDAIAEYQRFLELAPKGKDAASVEAHIVELREQQRRQHPLPLWLPITASGLGVAALATGLGLYYAAGARYDTCLADRPTMPCSNARIDATRSLERGGIGMLVTGGVLLAADVGLWVAYAHHRSAR